MSAPKKQITTALLFLLISAACATLTAPPTLPPETLAPEAVETLPPAAPQTAPPEPAETLAPVSCPALTDEIIAASLAESNGDEENLDEEIYLVTYAVSGDEISDPYYEEISADLQDEQTDEERHRRIWEYFAALIPRESRPDLAEYSIVTDGKDGGLAAVAQTLDDPYLWALEVDFADSADPYSLTFTLIHEFGHLLTLGPRQVEPSLPLFGNAEDNDLYLSEAAKCPQYFPGEGCSNADSYINAFYNRFWAELHDEWNDINLEEDNDAYYARLDEFYARYEDRFLTSYAVTNPEEDIAESWSFFVLAPKPAGETIAEEKILFFYDYPELTALRERILSNLCQNFPE